MANNQTFDFIKAMNAMQRIGKPPNFAHTPSEIIYREDKVSVLHYLPTTKTTEPIPIVLVPSLINKYYILDLVQGKSYVEFLTAQGFSVYLVDWGVVEDADKHITLEKYLDGYLANAVAEILRRADAKQISLIGYCMGGTMSLIYAALYAKQIRNLILLATPVDFHNNSLLSIWSREEYFDIDKLVDTYGNAPVSVLQPTFMMLKPAKTFTRYSELFANAGNDEFVETFLAFDYWANDAIPVAGETFRKFVKDTYQNNLLIKNKMTLGGRKIDLRKIKSAILNVIAEHDNIVPPESAEALTGVLTSKDAEVLKVRGGHHGITIGSSALNFVWKKTSEWMKERQK
ncbi:MAG TPA: alpha/beta fold hydrolase [Pyrinomonadaceae bacterium]|jgi:polyhydroxyalkanoate synthase